MISSNTSFLKKYKTALLLSLGGLLYTFCFPVSYYNKKFFPEALSALIIWFTFLPVLLCMRWEDRWDCFRKGYIFGLLFNSGIMFWVIMAIKKYGGMSVPLSISILALLIAFLALYPALSFYLTARFARTPWQRIILGSLFYSLFEWSRTFFPFGGVPWTNPGYALYGALTFIQALDIVGIQGFNFLILFTSYLLAEFFRDPQSFNKIKTGFVLSLGLILCCFVYGAARLQSIQTTIDQTRPIFVALIQGNIAQDEKWAEDSRNKIIQTYVALSKGVIDHNPVDLIVWPEAALPFSIHKETKVLPFSISDLDQVPLVAGVVTYETKNNRRLYLNSSFLSNPDGTLLQRYDKQRLVPFGEYVPMEKWIGWFVPAAAGNFSAGHEATLFPLRGTLFSTVICYESLFAEISTTMAKQGAQFFLNLTNDAWFDYTSGPFQHAQFGRFRTIETRRSFLRVANTGVTYWMEPTGKIHDETDLFVTKTVLAKAHPMSTHTFYVRFPWLVPAVMIALLAYFLFYFRKNRHV